MKWFCRTTEQVTLKDDKLTGIHCEYLSMLSTDCPLVSSFIKVICLTLENVAAASCSRGLCRWTKTSWIVTWSTVDNLHKGFSKIFAEKSIKYGVDTAVHVCQYVACDLYHHRRCGYWIGVERFNHQYYLQIK